MTTLAATKVRTPEGIDLPFRTATASERLVAGAIDVLVIVLLLVAIVLLVGFTIGAYGGPMVMMVWMFLLRQGYFVWCETRGRGTTIGKRRLNLRVVRADGGPLSVEILLARNLTREVEFFMPVIVLLYPDAIFAEHAGLLRLLATVWVLLPLLFPFFHPQRLRLGDLLAGTRVITTPPIAMLRDLADRDAREEKRVEVGFSFRTEQLEIYGEKELTVLEDLLRKARTAGGREGLLVATKSICKRIGWEDRQSLLGQEHDFLKAFYRAQREHLEQRMLLGKRRLEKKEKPAARRPRRRGPN